MLKEKNWDTKAFHQFEDFFSNNKVGFLSVVSPMGKIHSRPYVLQKLEPTGDLWFFIDETSAAAKYLSQFGYCSFQVSDSKNSNFACIEGPCEILYDRLRIYDYWNPVFRAWFPDGVVDEKLKLLKLKIEHAYFWNTPNNESVTLSSAFLATLTNEPQFVDEKTIFTTQRS